MLGEKTLGLVGLETNLDDGRTFHLPSSLINGLKIIDSIQHILCSELGYMLAWQYNIHNACLCNNTMIK